MKKLHPQVRTLVFKLCAFSFFWDLVFIYAVDKLLFLSRGLSLIEVALLMSIWAAITILMEVPSGILADRWNRKYLLIISGATRALLCVAWLVAESFSGFLVGFIFLGISQSFLSGTAQAYLHDALQAVKQEAQFEKFWGWMESSRLIGLSIAWAVGGWVSAASFTPSITLSLISGLACFLVGLSLPYLKNATKATEVNPFTHLLQALRFAFSHKVLLRVFLFAAIVRSTYVVVDEYWAVFFDSLHIAPSTFGVLVGLSTLSGSAAGVVAHKFRSRAWSTISLGTLLIACILLSAYISHSWIVVVLMLSLELITGILYILVEGQLQRHTAPEKRATIASVASLLKEMGIITGIGFGWIVAMFNLQTGYLYFAVLVLLYFPASIILERLGKKLESL